MDNSNPMDLLKEEMDSDEIFIRVNAIRRLKIIGQLMAPDQIKNILLPYLDNLIKKEEDEVLFAIAEELGNLGPYLGNQATVLVPYLERLFQNDETVVRDNALKSLQILYKILSENDVNNQLVPVVLKLASDQNNFTQRVSAIHQIVLVYPKAGDKKLTLRQKFLELSVEDTPMVKRAVASRIGDFSSVIEKEYLMSDIIPLFKQLTSDEQDSVRVISLETIKQIAKLLTKDENKTLILPIIIAATEDKSWRVRLSLAKNFYEVANSIGRDILDQSLLQTFINLLKDTEIEVKVAAIHSLKHLIELINSDKYAVIIPHLQNLCKDSNREVKSGVAEVMNSLFIQVKKEPSLSKLLANIIDFMTDQDQDVRIGGIKAASKYVIAYGLDALQNLLQHFKTSMNDAKWRVRQQTLNAVADMSVHFQNYDVFVKNLEPIFMLYLKDKFSSIREEGVSRLKELASVYKTEWVNGSLLPKLNECLAKEQSYLFRITAIYSLQQIMLALPNDYSQDKLVPLLLKCLKDPVPNVRFVTVKILKSFGKQHTFTKSFQNDLNALLNDTDKDVKIFAQQVNEALF